MVAVNEDSYIEAIEASFMVIAPQGISSDLQQVLNDNCVEVNTNSSAFWVMVVV